MGIIRCPSEKIKKYVGEDVGVCVRNNLNWFCLFFNREQKKREEEERQVCIDSLNSIKVLNPLMVRCT